MRRQQRAEQRHAGECRDGAATRVLPPHQTRVQRAKQKHNATTHDGQHTVKMKEHENTLDVRGWLQIQVTRTGHIGIKSATQSNKKRRQKTLTPKCNVEQNTYQVADACSSPIHAVGGQPVLLQQRGAPRQAGESRIGTTRQVLGTISGSYARSKSKKTKK